MTISFGQAEKPQDISQEVELSIEVTYIVSTDTPGEIVDEATVRQFAILNLPFIIDGIPRNGITAIERINPDNYTVKVSYLSLEPLDEEDEEIIEGPTDSFDTTGGTELITYGISRVAEGGNASAELGAAINYDGEKVNGVEITTPRYAFTRTIKLPDSMVTNAFKARLHRATGKTNLNPVEFFFPNEVLFQGAVGSKTTTFDDVEDEWEITYHFIGQESKTGIAFNVGLPEEFLMPLKEGWDYIWVQYQDKEDKGQKKIVKKAIAAYIIQVYEQTDFAELGFIE